MLLTRRAVHPAWGFGAGMPTKSFGSNGILLGWSSNLPCLQLWGRNTFKIPSKELELGLVATQVSTGAQGALGGAADVGCERLASLAQGESSVFVQGLQLQFMAGWRGKSCWSWPHGLFFFIIFFSGVAVLLLPHQSLGSLRALLLEKIPSVGILIALP